VRRLVEERRIPYRKIGRLLRFDPDEVEAWLDRCRIEARPVVTAVRAVGEATGIAAVLGEED
jgi:hypothetical protein